METKFETGRRDRILLLFPTGVECGLTHNSVSPINSTGEGNEIELNYYMLHRRAYMYQRASGDRYIFMHLRTLAEID